MQNPKPKTVILSLTAIITIGVVLGFFMIRNELSSPFTLDTNTIATIMGEDERAEVSILELQKKDTDNDTLSDYEELYTYDTSPFLADSDSDGDSDADEISADEDPNCPKGQECGIIVVPTNANTNSVTDIETVDDVIGEFQDIDIATVRETLLNAGAPQETLDQISDAELQQMYNDILSETAGLDILNTNSTATTNTTPASNTQPTNSSNATDDTLSGLENLTPDEMRELLIASGVDENTLVQIDDKTLRDIFSQAIRELTSGE